MIISDAVFTDDLKAEFIEAVHTNKPVVGLTHTFYRYPARFSPLFARAAIKMFTKPGDLILDPFMGGGTTLVEAYYLGRQAIGIDISSLAFFISKVKTTPLSKADISAIRNWADGLNKKLNLRNCSVRMIEWIEKGYHRNINNRKTWPIRKLLELAQYQLDQLPCKRQHEFARCVLLRTAQWALDCRKEIPTAEQFRAQFFIYLEEMLEGAEEFSVAVKNKNHHLSKSNMTFQVLCLNRSVIGIEKDPKVASNLTPRLILTSPPYPGVHVLYHRWQIQGRRETPAPFWIANCLDGQGTSFYTFGNRHQKGLTTYYEQAYATFKSLAQISDKMTLSVQMVGFSDPSWQLPKYLHIMEQTGFSEVKILPLANSSDGRLWRSVPNRKWYADQKGVIPSSKEVVLFHRLA